MKIERVPTDQNIADPLTKALHQGKFDQHVNAMGQSRGRLYSLGESVGCGGFKHRHMEDWMNRAHGLWKTEGEQTVYFG